MHHILSARFARQPLPNDQLPRPAAPRAGAVSLAGSASVHRRQRMRPSRSWIAITAVILALALGILPDAAQPVHAEGTISLTTIGSAYTQNFDTLSNTAGSTTNNLTITGWAMTESGGGARDNEQYAVDTGGSTTGDTYSYGAAGSTERALGQLRSGTLVPLYGAVFTNNTGSTITSLEIAFTGEQWRLGTAARTDQVNFEYSTNATDLSTGTWINAAALNFVTPDTATTGAKNGNAAGERTALSTTITGVTIANGASFWIRWLDTDASGADDGLAVDDFSLTPRAQTTNLTIDDASLGEGDSGTTSFDFTVSLSAPAGPGGVTFDIATADNTATTANSDYTAKSLTGQSIPAGSSTYSFSVLVTGDAVAEANETFFVNVTNVSGATVTDGQGLGTILNDDASDVAPAVTTTSPADGASGVATDATITVNFSEAVDAAAGGVTLECPSGTPVTAAGLPATNANSVTLTPSAALPAGTTCQGTVHATLITDADADDPPDAMAADVTWSFTTAAAVATNVIINELDSDTPGTDAAEFVELYDGGAGSTSLTGLVVVFYNGSNDLSYAAYDLDGYATGADGYFLLGNADVAPTPGIIFAGNWLQNGADAVALYTGNATDFPNNTPVTTANLVDAIVYDTSDADDAGLLPLLNASEPQVDENANANSGNESNQRCPNGAGGARNTSTYAQFLPTAGAANTCGADVAPTVDATVPANGAVNVAANTNLTVTFSEAVTASGAWYAISCATSGSHAATVSGGPAEFILDPDADFTASETCSATVYAAGVTDQDATPTPMAADYTFSFTIAASDPCAGPATRIHDVQGNGATSPLAGQSLTVQGIVVGDYETGGMKGYFVEEEDAEHDADPATSEGIFVYDNNATSEVALGDKVRVAGTVSEYAGSGYSLELTELNASAAAVVCASGQGNLVTPAAVTLPVTALSDLERFEGMLVTVPQQLTVTDNYALGYHGELTLSADGKLWQFTHLNAPSVSGYAAYLDEIALRSLLLDDGSTAVDPDPIFYPGTGLTAANTVRVDDTVTGLTGVLDQRYDYNRIQPVGPVSFSATNPRTGSPAAAGGNVRVASFNTLNFFTTISTTTCGPTGGMDCRGADGATEFTRQRNKLVAAICAINADVLGLMELENPNPSNDPEPGDGISDYVLKNLVGALNASSACPDDYAFIDDTGAGTDAIHQGIIYKAAVVTPVGTTAILDSTAFINGGDASARNRPALAQAFEENAWGERFIVSFNHLKSKGSACTAPDTLDGQANCAIVRTNAANALTSWLANDDPTGTGDPDVLIMGDLNSYRLETPITAIRNAGYTDLINAKVGVTAYGYAFDGQMGYLDHALGTTALAAQATGANEWHINSPEPDVLDYNTEYKSAGQVTSLYSADPYRSTDHDPVLVGLGLYADLSDGPALYPLAWHTGQGALRLGTAWSHEATATPGGDNASDDGVQQAPGFAWTAADGGRIVATVTGGTGFLTGWFDWNSDGDYADDGERAFMNEEVEPGAGQEISFPIPAGVTVSGSVNARFRLYAEDQREIPPAPEGKGEGGEVEDDTFYFGPNAVNVRELAARPAGLDFDPALGGLLALAGVLLLKRIR